MLLIKLREDSVAYLLHYVIVFFEVNVSHMLGTCALPNSPTPQEGTHSKAFPKTSHVPAG